MKGTLAVLCFVGSIVAIHAVFSEVPAPYWSASIGGTGDDSIRSVWADPMGTGSVYSIGQSESRYLNVSSALGQPLGTAKYQQAVQSFGPRARNDFLIKQDAMGANAWTVTLKGGSAAATIDALVGGEGKIFICGSFSDSAAIFSKNGVDSAVAFPTSHGGVDMYIAAIDASSGDVKWIDGVGSPVADGCSAIAYDPVNKVVVAGAMWNTGNADFSGAVSPTDGFRAISQPDYYVGANYGPLDGYSISNQITVLVKTLGNNTGTELVGGLWVNIGGSTNYVLDENSQINKIAFDSNGNMAVAGTVGALGSTRGFGPGAAGTKNIVINLWSASQLAVGPFSDRNSGEPAAKQVIGSAYDEILTGLAFVASANPSTNAEDVRLAIAGHTVNAVANDFFNFTAWDQYQDVTSLLSKKLNGPTTAWLATINGAGTATGGSVTQWGSATVAYMINGMARDPLSGDFLLGGSVKGIVIPLTAYTTQGGTYNYEAFAMRVSSTGTARWASTVWGSDFDEETTGVFFHPVPTPPTNDLRLRATIVGNYNKTNVWGPLSASPAQFKQFGLSGGTDAFTMSLDEYDDCDVSGTNVCGVTSDKNAIGSFQCLDDAAVPFCLCNMNSTGTLCNARGWSCSLMLPYYLGILNTCNCPQPASPTPGLLGPIQDIIGRFSACIGSVCTFKDLTGANARCLPLTLDLLGKCGNDPTTPATDLGYIATFLDYYGRCFPKAGSSSTGGAIVFGAAPPTNQAATTTTIAAVAAAIVLMAAQRFF